LQKEPSRRYESSLALADDLKRYLEHRPILARPAGRVERTWRWCRRNPRLAGAIGTAVAFAAFTVIASTTGYVLTKAAKAKSDARLQRALVVVDDLFTRISEEELLNQPGMQPLRKELLEKALKHYQYFLEESGDDPAIQDEIAAAHFRIGLISLEMGEYDLAKSELRSARAQQDHLLQSRPGDTRRMEALGDTLTALGKLMGRRDLWQEAAGFYDECDLLRSKLANLKEQDLGWQRKLASVRMNLGLVEMNLDQREKGRRHMQNAQERRLAILTKDSGFTAARRDLAQGYFNLANYDSLDFFALSEPRPVEAALPAISNLREAIKHFELLGLDDFANRFKLAISYRLIGGLYMRVGRIDDAIKAYESARPLITVLALANPDVIEYQSELVGLAMNQGPLYEKQNNLPQAQQAWTTARAKLEELLASDPKNIQYHYDLATTLDALADNYGILGQLDEKISTLKATTSQLDYLINVIPEESNRAELRNWQMQVNSDLAAVLATLKDSGSSLSPSSLPSESVEKNP
jgi:tetratricopeptide (TPR) repeat protein